MSRTSVWRQITVPLIALAAFLSCQKPQESKEPIAENPELPNPTPITSVYEPLASTHSLSFYGTSFTTDLKIKNGDNIGTVTVANDATNLYLMYNLSDKWYLTGVQSYAGEKAFIPKKGNGNADPAQFPGQQKMAACELKQSFAFKVPLSELKADERELCPVGLQYFVAMRAMVRKIENTTDCNMGYDQEAWGAPVLINPGGNLDEWATAFYYCQQECTPWKSRGQGYWFASGKHAWCGDSDGNGEADVVFDGLDKDGNTVKLVVNQTEGVALWDQKGKPSVAQKAFFKAAAVQLSLRCLNNGDAVPESISEAYNTICNALANMGLETLKKGNMPANIEDINTLKDATSKLSQWICDNSCNDPEDPTACAVDSN